jgi:hypothetical protein
MSKTLMRRSTGIIGFATALTMLNPGLGAFGDVGHRVVSILAERHLQNSRALGEVRKILRSNETLADASVWHDVIKDPLYEDGDTPMFRLQHPGHDTYHYANRPFQVDRYEFPSLGARPTDIVQMLRESVRVLRGSSTMFTRREALRLLAHLVGDIHQPMHISSGFVTASGALRFIVPTGPTGWRPTLGGNALVYGPQDRFNLHSYWDSHIVNLARGQDDAVAYAARLFQEMAVAQEWKDTGDVETWPQRWATEGLAYAKDAYRGIEMEEYIGPDETGRTAHRWRIRQPPDYDGRSRARVRAQLAKGGYRLAAVLRAIWPD